MILIDTQVLVWWTIGGDDLAEPHRRTIEQAEGDGIAASAISVWEVAMLVNKRRMTLDESLQRWLDKIMTIPTLHILPATPQILLDSTQLPGVFHSDPADRIIVATARAHGSMLLTTDGKILAYEHVRSLGPSGAP
jgi:PIN domain nuclease of toxin-antitoxin system